MPPSPNNPQMLGKFELLHVIEDLPDGRAYKAVCRTNQIPGIQRDELVALKRLKSAGYAEKAEEFHRQGRILRGLVHPNIAQCRHYFACQDGDAGEEAYCIVTDYFEGETLQSLLAKNRSGLQWPDTRNIFMQVMQALRHAHENGVVHRNLRPSAIQIAGGQLVKLADFGLTNPAELDMHNSKMARTASRALDYLGPEFAKMPAGFLGDAQSDVYSLGVCIFQALTGSLPQAALGSDAIVDYLARWLAAKAPEPDVRHPIFRVLRRARACVTKSLEPERAKRYKTVSELMDEFSRITYKKLRHGSEVYEFVEWLGKGGFGEVFRARRLSDGRELAVKRLFNATHSARFLREARILRDSNHPNLVQYVDFVEVRLSENEREYYLVLEYLEGMPAASLRNFIKNSENGMNPALVLRIFSSYLDCLEHLHVNGIIHRDIKPGNLYVSTANPEAGKIFDLGIAYDDEGTRTQGQVLGTLDYMPPEFASQSSGRGSAQSDIYSLGVSLYQSLTKKLPFPRLPDKDSEGWMAFFQRAQKPVECAFDHPVFQNHPELVPFLRKSLAPLPSQRYSSARAMREELVGLLENLTRDNNKPAFDEAMSAAQAAVNASNFDEAELEARRALELLPFQQDAVNFISGLREARRNHEIFESHIRVAWEALERAEYTTVENRAARALAAKPGNSVAAQLLALAREAKGHARPLDVATAAARAALSCDKFEEAENYSNQALNLDPGNSVAIQLLARAVEGRIEKGMFLAAIDHAKQAVEKGDWAEAGQQASHALKLKPDDIVAKRLLARSRELRQADPAAAEMEKREQEQAGKRIKFVEIAASAKAALDKADFDEAERHIRKALELFPGDSTAIQLMNQAQAGRQNRKAYESYISLIRQALQREDFDAAENQALSALALAPADPMLRRLLDDTRDLQRKRKQFDSALASARAALAIDEFVRAEEHWNRAAELKPDDASALQLITEIREARQKKNLFDSAIAYARSALERDDYDEAENQAARALELRPGDSSAVKFLAQVREDRQSKKLFDATMKAARESLARENFDEAEKLAQRALELRPTDPTASLLASELRGRRRNARLYQAAFSGAEVAIAEEDYEEAERLVKRAIGFKPDDNASIQLLARLRTLRR